MFLHSTVEGERKRERQGNAEGRGCREGDKMPSFLVGCRWHFEVDQEMKLFDKVEISVGNWMNSQHRWLTSER